MTGQRLPRQALRVVVGSRAIWSGNLFDVLLGAGERNVRFAQDPFGLRAEVYHQGVGQKGKHALLVAMQGTLNNRSCQMQAPLLSDASSASRRGKATASGCQALTDLNC